MGKKKTRKQTGARREPEAPAEQPRGSKRSPPKHQKNGRGGHSSHRPSNAHSSSPPADSDRSYEKLSTAPDGAASDDCVSDVRPCPSGPFSTTARTRSASECAMPVNPRPPDVPRTNISVDNDPICLDSSDSRMPVRDIRKPSKDRRSLSVPPVVPNERNSNNPHPYAPMSVKDLLAPVEEVDSPANEEKDAFHEFTGGAKLQLKEKGNYMDVCFEEAALDGEGKRCLSWMMDGLGQMISPVARNNLFTVEDAFEDTVDFAQSVEESDRKSVIAKKEAFLVKETMLWMRRLFFVHCCSAGFVASDFIDIKAPLYEKISMLNHKNELDLLLGFADRLGHSDIIFDGRELLTAAEEIMELLKLVERESIDELAKRNIVYSLNDPVDRLRFNRSITDDELFEIVDQSVTSDCGKYLWIVDRCPEMLKGSGRIVASIVKGISLKRVSKDQRPSRAYYTLVPQLAASLTDEELHSLAQEHVDNRERKVDNWPEMMYEGYLMSLTNIKDKPKGTNDIVLLKLLEVDSVDGMRHFLFACALIAEFNPDLCRRVYDFSMDSFCTRLARVFMSSQISPAKRSLLLQALMSLPGPFKDRLLARGEFNPEHSLYHTVKAICTEMPRVQTTDIRKWGPLVVKELATVLSPARMISFAIIPCLANNATRLRAAVLLPELLACEKLPEELLEEKGGLSPAQLVKIALEQYEEPQGDAPKARYGFIEGILKLIDGILVGDVPQRMIDDIDAAFEEKGLSWQQHYALLHITLPKSQGKLRAPKIPPVDFTLEGMTAFNSTALLQTWPNRDDVRGVFEKGVSGLFANEDKVLIAYGLLSAATGQNSKIKEHFDFLKSFVGRAAKGGEQRQERSVEAAEENPNEDKVGAEIEEGIEMNEETLKDGEESEKNSEVEEADEKSEQAETVDLTQENSADEGEEEPRTWLTQMLLEASDVNQDLRRAVLRIAVDSEKYSREATRIQLAVSISANSPKKDKKPAEVPVVWDEEVHTTAPSEKNEEKPLPADGVADVVQTTVPVAFANAEELVLPPETPVPPVSSCVTAQSTPAPIPSLIVSVERASDRYPMIHRSNNVNERRIVLFDENLAARCGDFVGFLLSRRLRDELPPSIKVHIGGRRPDIPCNDGRPLLANPSCPLYMEIVSVGNGKDRDMDRAVTKLKIECREYLNPRNRSPRPKYNAGEGFPGEQNRD